METARVDLQRLQFLNDRIQQTIEALNQVRLSVHALSRTSGIPGMLGVNGPQQVGYGAFPWQAYGVPSPVVLQNPQMVPQMWGGAPFGYGAFSHAGQEVDPTIHLRRAYGIGQNDPFVAGRVAETLPFAQSGYSPFVSGQMPYAPELF